MKQTTAKYMLVSLLATVSDFLVFSFLGMFNPQSDAVSTIISMLVGAVVAWSLHYYWVFRHSLVSFNQKWKRYVGGIGLSMLFNVLIMALLADLLACPRMASRVCTSMLVWAIGFWFNRRMVFKV
jgi:putative flippase GtrA